MGHCLSVPPQEELALHSSWATGRCSGGPAETRLEGGKVRELALGQRLGCPTRVSLPTERRAMADTDPRERGAWEPLAGIGEPPRIGLGAHPLSREGSCSEGRDPGHLPDEVATELGFKE